MLSDISKDKSLKTLLLKADLDVETAELINSHPSIIKESLIKNMNASNITEYRRLIQKAEDEEQRTLDESDVEFLTQLGGKSNVGSAVSGGGGGATTVRDAATTSLEGTEEGEVPTEDTGGEREYESIVSYREFTKLHSNLTLLKNLIPHLQTLAERVSVEKSPTNLSGFDIEGTESYSQRVKDKNESNTVFNILSALKKNKEFFKGLSPHMVSDGDKLTLVAPMPPRKTDKQGEEIRRTKKSDIDVSAIRDAYLELLDKKFEFEGGSITFIDLFKALHIDRFDRNPASVKDKSQYSSAIARSLKRLRGEKDTTALERNLKKMKTALENFSKLEEKNQKIDSNIQSLIDLKGGDQAEMILARGFESIASEIRRIMQSGSFGATPAEKTKMLRELEALKANRDKVLARGTASIQEEIDAELAKLELVNKEMNEVSEYKEDIEEIITVIQEFIPYEKTRASLEKELSVLKKDNKSIPKIIEGRKMRLQETKRAYEENKEGEMMQAIQQAEKQIREIEGELKNNKKKISDIEKTLRKTRAVSTGLTKLSNKLSTLNSSMSKIFGIVDSIDEVDKEMLVGKIKDKLKEASDEVDTKNTTTLGAFLNLNLTEQSRIYDIDEIDAVKAEDVKKLERAFDKMYEALRDIDDVKESMEEAFKELRRMNA